MSIIRLIKLIFTFFAVAYNLSQIEEEAKLPHHPTFPAICAQLSSQYL